MNPAISPFGAHLSAALLAILFVSACTPFVAYVPASVDEQLAPSEFLKRSTDDVSLADLVGASAYQGQWPPDQWRLDALTLIALYFNPEIDVAHAQAIAARAALTTAAQRSPLGVQFAAEHHSRETSGDGPWSLGVAIDLPIGTRARRQAHIDKAALLADAAELEIASAAWRVRAAVRDALIGLISSGLRTRVLQQRLSIQKEMEKLVQRRVDAGMLSSRELGAERIAVAAIETELAVESTREANARGDLARALGLPLETVRSFKVADDALTGKANIPDVAAARTQALRNRLDVHARLLEFGAADAEVRIAVAAQYPSIKLSPGFMWDQGENVWSLLSGLVLPAGAHAAVREAEARRETAARRFTALQINVIGEVDHVRDVLRVTQARLNTAAELARLSQSLFDKIHRLFQSGAGDRASLVAARLSEAQAQQHFLEAQEAWRKSIAHFEDVTQYPVMSDFLKLPGIQTPSGLTQSTGKTEPGQANAARKLMSGQSDSTGTMLLAST